ncbi:hypothetical protein PanWU01x14_114440 [Parasponia andersonii]|uniref:Heat shock factor binding protein n=1 Tax=Parasponia andersonii TaxID=3476 RepID=A0A2P5CXE8_PARAD|nr:hypothetical protein PanWU01x14_114440 [Parasponia andersonii]
MMIALLFWDNCCFGFSLQSLGCDSVALFCSQVQDLLQQMSINDLKAEMGMEGSPSPVAASKPNADGVKQEEGSA